MRVSSPLPLGEGLGEDEFPSPFGRGAGVRAPAMGLFVFVDNYRRQGRLRFRFAGLGVWDVLIQPLCGMQAVPKVHRILPHIYLFFIQDI